MKKTSGIKDALQGRTIAEVIGIGDEYSKTVGSNMVTPEGKFSFGVKVIGLSRLGITRKVITSAQYGYANWVYIGEEKGEEETYFLYRRKNLIRG